LEAAASDGLCAGSPPRGPDLGAEAFARRKKRMHTLPESYLLGAEHPFRFAMADGQRPKLSWFSALAGALVLARRCESNGKARRWSAPVAASVPGALANYAAMLLGKVPVNLNYTVSMTRWLLRATMQFETIVTARFS